jgi:cytochrome c
MVTCATSQQSSPVKNRMREICTSGSVGGEGGNILAYPAACHGLRAAGTEKGPPLVHDIYNPGHHADIAFFTAAKLGVRQHNWPYGDMPAQRQVTEEQIAAIVQYIREFQLANGIGYRPHRM